MGKTLVIGAKGLLGSHVVSALGEDQCIQASRSSSERVDISDTKSMAALFDRVGDLDGIVCAGGAARFKPWEGLGLLLSQQTDGSGQRRAARSIESPIWRRDHPDDWGARAASDARRVHDYDGQCGGRSLRACRSRRTPKRPRQRSLPRLGGRDAAGDGTRSSARNPSLGGCTGLRAAAARGVVGFDCARCTRLKTWLDHERPDGSPLWKAQAERFALAAPVPAPAPASAPDQRPSRWHRMAG
jgi:hypothetical protein